MIPLNVMVVDDSVMSAKKLAGVLGLLGHRVVKRAGTGTEAVEAYPKYMPDLVTMDITMPDMDGVEATKQIRAAYPDALIILVTSHGQERMVMEAINAGARGYLRKPVDKDDLQRLIDKIVTETTFEKPNTRICALMFADIANSSHITQDNLKSHLHILVRGQLAEIDTRFQVVHSEFTGDGFFICGTDATEMAEAALGARDHIQALDWRDLGYGGPIAIRIGLALEKVSVTEKDGQVIDVAGSGVDRAARIEPIVTPGQVWCSGHFYRQLEREGGNNVLGMSLGVKDLHKGAGQDELYALRWKKG